MKAGATYNSGKCPYSSGKCPYSASDGHAEIVGFGHYDGMKFNICADHWAFYKNFKKSTGGSMYECELYPILRSEPAIEPIIDPVIEGIEGEVEI